MTVVPDRVVWEESHRWCGSVRGEVIAEIEQKWAARLGARKMRQLHQLLQELNENLKTPVT